MPGAPNKKARTSCTSTRPRLFVLFVGQCFLNPVTILLRDVQRLHGLLRRHVQILHQVAHGRNPLFLAALPNALPASLLDSLFKVTIAGFDAGKNLPCGPRLRANGCDGDETACVGALVYSLPPKSGSAWSFASGGRRLLRRMAARQSYTMSISASG